MSTAKLKFNWAIDADLVTDLPLDYFEEEFDVRQFEWDVAVWWNKNLAGASWLGQTEAVEQATALPDTWTQILQGRSTPAELELAEAFIKSVSSRLPRSEKRCIDHLEVAVSHVLRANADYKATPWMLYDADTGVWRQSGEWMSSGRIGVSVDSAIDSMLGDFEAALNRGIDTVESMINMAEPDPGPKPPAGAAQATKAAWDNAAARRKRLYALIKDSHDMARLIPRGKYNQIKTGLRTRLAISQTKWDENTNIIVLKDGVLELEDVMKNQRMHVRPFSPYDMSTMALEVASTEEVRNAGKSEWAKGVEKVLPDQEVREYLQKRFGAALLGRPGVAGKSMVWQYGAGDTAKSTLQECIAGAHGVFAPYALTSASRAITMEGQRSGDTGRFVAYARGKRFAIMSELNSGEKLDGAQLKSIAGGETVEGTAKYANSVAYFFTATLFMASNHPPTFPPGDTALVGRIHVVPFNHRLWIRSKNPEEWATATPEHRADESWKEKVLESAQERAAIFNWVIDGLMAFARDGGLGELPSAMRTAQEDFASEADPVATIVRATLGLEPGWEGRTKMRICTDLEWELMNKQEKDGLALDRVERIFNDVASELNLIRFPDMKLSGSYMNAAKRMLHEMGGSKKKVAYGTGVTGIAFARVLEVPAYDGSGL